MQRNRILFVCTLLLTLLFFKSSLKAQDKITFISADKLIITADVYMVSDTMPYMILCHDIKSSRGEYKDLAKKFTKLGYNCIAIDMRVGGTKNGITNETSSLAQAKHIQTKLLDCKTDIDAAIDYAYGKSKKKVVLVGCGFSAAITLYIGSTNARIASVLAFSPSGVFVGLLDTKTAFPKCNIPVFITSSKAELPEVKKYVAAIPSSKVTLFEPPTEGSHGVDGLLSTASDHHDYWLSILMFVRQIQGGGY
ncbi:MAG TPA: dienelactone hydrolase family protein [Bacteroidia bacterium]|nr:dienelactone hydrolase family protein [Bacteroidia bacterium]